MNRKRRIYVGLTVAAVAIFLVDRIFLGEPAEAEAKQTRPNSGPRRPSKTPSANTPTGPRDPSLRWLERLTSVNTQRDLFSPSPELLLHYRRETEQAEQLAGGVRGAPQPGSWEAFVEQHQLQATVVTPGSMLAVVSGKPLRLGDSIEDFRLEKVEPDRAEFSRGRERVTLLLPMPPPERDASRGPLRQPPPTSRHQPVNAPDTRVEPAPTSTLKVLQRLLFGAPPARPPSPGQVDHSR
ncbi:MAG: hypothetical protein AMXMBFR13_01280 [Phycisphaerae bacterium]